MKTETADSPPWYRQGWPWFLLLLPATAVLACVITLLIAIRHADSLVSDDYYKQGLAINRVLARDENARAHAITGELRLETNTRAVELRLTGVARFPAALRLEFLHPVDARHDRHVSLRHKGGGLYVGKSAPLRAGNYYVVLEPQSDKDRDWRLRGRLPFGTHALVTARLDAR